MSVLPKHAHWTNNNMKIMEVTNHFRLDLSPAPLDENHCWTKHLCPRHRP